MRVDLFLFIGHALGRLGFDKGVQMPCLLFEYELVLRKATFEGGFEELRRDSIGRVEAASGGFFLSGACGPRNKAPARHP